MEKTFFFLFDCFCFAFLLVPAKLRQIDLQISMKDAKLTESRKGLIYFAQMKLQEGNASLHLQKGNANL